VSIGAVLAHLLLTAVEGTDVGVDIGDLFAVEDRLAVEHAVGPGSCGPILMNIVFGLAPILLVHGFRRDRCGLERLALLERDGLRAGPVVVQRERVALPGLRQEDAPQVGVVLVLDADEVVSLALVPR